MSKRNSNIISGIYKIENLINHKVYIGQSVNIYSRFNQHTVKLEANPHLKRAFLKYGFENFSFEIIKKTYDLDYWEMFLIQLYKSDNINYGYNILKGGQTSPSKNKKVADKISKSLNNLYSTEKGKLIIKSIQNGRKETMNNWTNEKRKQVSDNMSKGKNEFKKYILSLNTGIVKHFHQWKIEDNKEITISKTNHLLKIDNKDIIKCKEDFFINFEKHCPTLEEVQYYQSQLPYIKERWRELRWKNNKKELKPFICLEENKVYNDIETFYKLHPTSQSMVLVKYAIRCCCEKTMTSTQKLHFAYAENLN